MTAETAQLILVRQLAIEADRQLSRDDAFGHGLAVSLMQDAVELLIRIVIRLRGIEVGPRATWEQMADAISKAAADDDGKVPHRARLEDLNKARVAFKHSGTAPSKVDARRLVSFGLEFLEAATPRFVGIEYAKISLSAAVRNDEIRGLLIQAQTLLSEERWRDAMVEAADAVKRSESALNTLLPKASSVSGLRDEQSGLAAYLDRLRLLAVGALVDIDPVQLLIFQAIVPSVARSANGQRYVTFTRMSDSRDEAEGAVDFAIQFALAVERRFGDSSELGQLRVRGWRR
ncbi:MAG TPA: hypothetical protein VIN03_13835 [Roseateles sp.]